MKTVLVFGTFDMLHPGHIFFFKEARKQGDRLVVVIARDLTVKQVKGSFPQNNEMTRLEEVKKIEEVDDAMLGSSTDDKLEIIEKIKPDVICLGYDQKAFAENLEDELVKRNLFPEVKRLEPYKAEKYKTSKLRKL
jgi:FAD synthetase